MKVRKWVNLFVPRTRFPCINSHRCNFELKNGYFRGCVCFGSSSRDINQKVGKQGRKAIVMGASHNGTIVYAG
jgi:hypothetical protein